jgi:hypothetical protein
MNENHRVGNLSRHGKRIGRPPAVSEESRLLFQQLRMACREACDLMLAVAEEEPDFVLACDQNLEASEATYADLHHGLMVLGDLARKRERR